MLAHKIIKIKRTHGLGDVIMLMPILKTLTSRGFHVILYTKKDLFGIFKYYNGLNKKLILKEWNGEKTNIDLDNLTLNKTSNMHRTEEFYELCQIFPKFFSSHLNFFSENTLIINPEANHPSRQWQIEKIKIICRLWLKHGPVVIVGQKNQDIQSLPCSNDLRGKTTLTELLYQIHNARLVLSMDAGALHIAGALGKPTVAVFGNINPWYRIKYYQNVIALAGDIDCFPCNKKEKCHGRQFECINLIMPGHVIKAIKILLNHPAPKPKVFYCSGKNKLKQMLDEP